MKFIAYYFPQFHAIKENNEWWGNGFTDWDYVKNAQPLYNGHYLPRIPLNKNYYDLTQDEIIKWQVGLAKKYGIDGFCFHHYWFDGKLLLEKPLEIFLKNKNFDISFCISWANESWTKRWIGKNNVVLQEQKHTPDKAIWEKHFNYLLPFFKDKRHIKIEDKPVFIIYQPDLLNKSTEMFNFWDEMAKKNGLNGIYFIATQNHRMIKADILNDYKALIKFQPREAYNSKAFKNKSIFSRFQFLRALPLPVKNFLTDIKQKVASYEMISSDEIWDTIIKNAQSKNENKHLKTFESVFIEWDNTPRYRDKSKIFYGATPQKFEKNLNRLIDVIEDKGTFMFINAWNEWSECAYLEPDEKYGYSYLEVIEKIKSSKF